MPAMSAPEFLNIFKSRREYCQALLELSSQQSELIAGDHFEQLLTLLGQKQRLLARLDELRARQPELWQQWRVERAAMEPDLRDDCEHVLAETEAILADLVQHENSSTEFLTDRRDKTRQKLQTASQGSEVHSAYRDGMAPTTHRHLDIDQ